MDQLRQNLALSAKHLDTQIALLMMPEFSRGLPPSLVGDTQSGLNVGLKALQIGGNAVVPMLEHLGSPLADRFPTHAEQFNQNINSQGMGACQLAQQSLDLYRRHLAIALIIAVQACDLRAHVNAGHYGGATLLSRETQPLYGKVRELISPMRLATSPAQAPLVWSDVGQSFSQWIERLTQDLAQPDSQILSALSPNLSPLFVA